MKKQINFTKIGQFRQVVKAVRDRASYAGEDEDGNTLYNKNITYPKALFVGTVKLHGTNGGVCFNHKDGFWVQSRNRILSLESDNAGFYTFAKNREYYFTRMITSIAKYQRVDLNRKTITVYGEWAGRGIQKGVAISELDKAFYVFAIKISYIKDPEDYPSYYISIDNWEYPSKGIYNIASFTKYFVDIDFNSPEYAQEKMIGLVNEVEAECPVAKHLGGITGTGEGIVWNAIVQGREYTFKTKGQKHSISKVKKLAAVDIEKLNNIKEFISYAVSDNRFKQALQEVFGIDAEPDIKKLGDVIRWVIKDIINEEGDVMLANNLTLKDVNKYISGEVKKLFFSL